jgi:hypothetical protein
MTRTNAKSVLGERLNNVMSIEAPNGCPQCDTNKHLIGKMILIGARSPRAIFGEEEMCGYKRKDQLAIDECQPELLRGAPLQQFVDGYFCAACGIGFVDNSILID